MPTVHFPIDAIREDFPALLRTYNGYPVAYFDGPGGTQVASPVIEQIMRYMEGGVANLGGVYTTSEETSQIVDHARLTAATLLGADAKEIVFGANTTTLAFRIARSISKDWQPKMGNIVVTELDHHANIDPWVTAAQDKGLEVRSIPVLKDTLTLDLEQAEKMIDEETKLIAIGYASNAVGTINEVEQIVNWAKKAGALVIVDAVHAVPHFLVDFKALQADIMFCSAYKFFGPHVGVAAICHEFYEELSTFKLRPHPSETPYKLETGTINFEGLIGLIEAIRWIAHIGEGSSLREQLKSAYRQFEAYENMLADRLRQGLSSLQGITLYQAPTSVPKTPTVAFTIKHIPPKKVCEKMAELAIHIESGDFYAMTVVKRLGLTNSGGLIRAGIAPYNTVEEIDRLIEGIERLVHKPKFPSSS